MEEDSWGWDNLKYGLSELILPKLKEYRDRYLEEGMCIPTWLTDEEKKTYTLDEENLLRDLWIVELDKMILGFRQMLNYKTGENESIDYDEDIIQEGLDSFGKYFQHFWD